MAQYNLSLTRDLIGAWASRTIRARYQQSALGWLWAIIQPAAVAAIYTVIFSWIVPIDTGGTPYVVFSYAAVIPWTFLSASLTDMTLSLVGNMDLVSKIYFPREALPVAAMVARLMDFGIAAILLLVLMLIFGIPMFQINWLFLPVIIAIQLLLALGLGLACAAANVFYRDVQSFITLGLQIWFYATPIIYPLTAVPETFRPYYLLNPMVGIIEAYRAVLIYNRLPDSHLLISAVIALLIFLLGYRFFKRVEFQFADII
ncbi:MAG: ABC transporter permease [Anaerolineales bacterium]|nr:ABC transporter permease [Anaerolineales bacterium]